MAEHKLQPDFPAPGEAEDTFHAIRSGAVDAFVVQEDEGHRVYALESADLPYSVLVERMQQGAAMLNAQGEFLSCNPSLATLLGVTKEEIIGKPLRNFLSHEDREAAEQMLAGAYSRWNDREMRLRRADGTAVAANFSFQLLARDKSATGLLVADLTVEKEREELAVRLQRIQDEERRNPARELHDSVGQLLAALSMNLGRIERDKTGPEVARAAQDSVTLVNTISKEIRTISYLLHPPLLELAGLASAIRWYVDGFSERSKIAVDVDIPHDLPRLPEGTDLTLYRMVQECLSNVHRHSGSKWCSLKVMLDQDRLQIEIADSGRGIPKEKQENMGRTSVGLRGMQERLRQLGGTLTLRSDENGTTVTASLPIQISEELSEGSSDVSREPAEG